MPIPESKHMSVVQRLVLVSSALAVLTVAVVASAAGRLQWTTTSPKERTDTQSWQLEVAIFFPKAPDVPHVPMKFEFKPTAYFERDLVDGDKIVERKVPLENNQDIIEDVDIGFLDPSDGKIQSRTKFSFRVTRAHGFDAGEYTVTIRDARNGQVVGSPTHFVLDGQNEPIDRRTMVFSGPDKPKKKKSEMKQVDRNGDVKDDKGGDAGTGDKGGDQGGDDGGSAASDDKGSDTSAASDKPAGDNGENGGPPPVKGKSGCGCHLERTASLPGSSTSLAALGLIAAFVARRRRRARAA